MEWMKNKIWIVAGAATLIAVLVVVLSTGEPPAEEAQSAAASNPVTDKVDRDLAVGELAEDHKEKLEEWKESGLIREILTMSHEVYIDPAMWSELTFEEKEAVVRVLSGYLKSLDGTRQVIVKEHGSKKFLADFFADTLRIAN